MTYAIVVDDELEPSEQAPGRRSQLPDMYRPEVDPDGALALLTLVKQVATPNIRVDHYWNPREAKTRILNATEAPLVLVLDIVNEREGTETQLSTSDRRCGLVLARIAAEKWPRTPILFLTQLDCHDERGALKEAANVASFGDFITKRTAGTKAVLWRKLENIFKPYLDQVLQSGELKIDAVRVKTFWRGFELGSVASKRDYPHLDSDLDLTDTRLTPREFLLLQFTTRFALNIWSRPGPTQPALVTFEEIIKANEELDDESIHKHIKNIRKKLASVETSLFNGKKERAFGIFVNAKRAYIFTERT